MHKVRALNTKSPLTGSFTVPEVGLEPTHLSAPHFECGASANSATRACRMEAAVNTVMFRPCENLLYMPIG